MSIENNENNNSLSFDESNFSIKSRSVLGQPEVPGMIRFMVNKGLVKNSGQAMIIILIIIILMISLSIFFITKSATVPPAFVDSKSDTVNN